MFAKESRALPVADFLRQQRRSSRWLPWIIGAAGIATLLAAWISPSLPTAWRIALNVAGSVFAVAFAFVIQRRLSDEALEADRVGERVRALKARAAIDPLARAEYTEYLTTVIEMLQTTPASRGTPVVEHAAHVKSAVQRLRAEQADLRQIRDPSHT